MIVVCVDVSSYRLTKGKVYEVIDEDTISVLDDGYVIIDDNQLRCTFYKFRFKSPKEIRNKKIGEILGG
jgi:hypothetical protein